MRIAMVSTPFVSVPPRNYGGTELVVHELVRGLTSAGHHVTLFATGDSRAPDLRWIYREAVWPPRRDVEVRHCAAAADAIARARFDVVHAHVPAFLALAGDLDAPLVNTLHHDHDPQLTRLYLRRRSAHHVAISARQAQLEPLLRCAVVHHGLDPARYPAGAGDGGYALFLGRLAPCKAPELAIAAARAARIPIRVAGPFHGDHESAAWRRRVERALASPGVETVGPVGGARKGELLGAARALLMPLSWEEPFGLVMIEAMLCGTPVLAFPRGAAPEIVDEGVTGFLVEGVDEMAAILTRLRGFDRAACRRRAQQRFSSARMVRDYERIYAHAASEVAPGLAEEGPSYAG